VQGRQPGLFSLLTTKERINTCLAFSFKWREKEGVLNNLQGAVKIHAMLAAQEGIKAKVSKEGAGGVERVEVQQGTFSEMNLAKGQPLSKNPQKSKERQNLSNKPLLNN
jgi:hypothetical protein